MKVTRVRTTPLSIPFKEAYHWSPGISLGINVVLVKVETDQGIVGIGEASGERSVDAVEAVIRSVLPIIEGQSPFEVERFLQRSYRSKQWGNVQRFANQAIAGLEMAMWDIIGKTCSQPLHRLMGGKVREKINWFGFLQGDVPEKLARDAVSWREKGFDVIYMKVGRGRDRDLECVRAVREAIGDNARLRVDANEAWNVGTAINTINDLSEYDLEFVEQPVAHYDLAGLKRVHEAVDVPIAVDQGAFTEYDVLEIIKRGVADIITIGPHEAGGLLPLRRAAAIASAGNVPICRHGVLGETGITTCSMLQVLATIPNITDGNQVMHQLLVDDILIDGLVKFKEGCIKIPDRPGLGVELDQDKVQKYAKLYNERGQFLNR